MSDEPDSALLLRTIADVLGVDARVFQAVRRGVEAPDAEGHHRALVLSRLIRTFQGLPDDAHRLQALQILEVFAAQSACGGFVGETRRDGAAD